VQLRTATEDLQLQGDPDEERQHHASGDQMNSRLNGRSPHEADAV
jgi:hypothetical protein